MSETQARFSEAEKILLFGWLEERPQIAKTRKNAQLIGDYLQANNLKATLGNLDKTFQAIKGQLEVYKTPVETEQEKTEAVRAEIYRQVSERIAPAKLNFGDWDGTMRILSNYLYQHHGGRMTVDNLMEAILATKLSLAWVVEPRGLAKNRRNESLGYDDSRTEHGVQGRRNHAEDTISRESEARTKKLLDKLKEDESRVIGKALFEDSIGSYVAVRNGRISASQTEAVKKALRKYAEKHGSAVLALIREMPDSDATEMYIRKRI